MMIPWAYRLRGGGEEVYPRKGVNIHPPKVGYIAKKRKGLQLNYKP